MKGHQAAVAAVEEELRELALAGQLQDLGSRFRVVPQQYHKVRLLRGSHSLSKGTALLAVVPVGCTLKWLSRSIFHSVGALAVTQRCVGVDAGAALDTSWRGFPQW